MTELLAGTKMSVVYRMHICFLPLKCEDAPLFLCLMSSNMLKKFLMEILDDNAVLFLLTKSVLASPPQMFNLHPGTKVQ